MPEFNYKAMTRAGTIVDGELQAANVEDLGLRLERMGLDLIRLKSKRTAYIPRQQVTRQEMISFCFYMEQLIRGGVPLLQGLTDLRDSLHQCRFKEIISVIIEDVGGGESLSDAMARYPKVFDEVFISLIRAGEVSGTLDRIFQHLSESIKRQDELIEQTKKILLYPLFVAAVVAMVVFFLMTFLVPDLVSFITSMGEELPLHTKALLATSSAFENYWHLMLIVPILAWLGLAAAMKMNYQVRLKVDEYKLRIWPVGPVLKKIILARFASFFGLMYASGITVLDCLKITQTIAGNRFVEATLQKVHEQISEGMGISDSFAKTKLFPPLVIRMLNIGEKTGKLDKSLENVTYFYARDVQESIEKLQTMIGPALTVVLGGVLAWIMISVLGPIYDIIGKITSMV
ncbi:MAG: type II secretion system F family protein [Gammaproteobacteria bacterium]|nr:type II secretion system F family protein [Gammaproteobacteria bacterium]